MMISQRRPTAIISACQAIDQALPSSPMRVRRVDFVMSADVRFSANSGPIDWQLPALCRVPLIARTRMSGAARKTSLADTFLTRVFAGR